MNLNFTIIDIDKTPTTPQNTKKLKEHQCIGLIHGKDCTILISGKASHEQEDLILQRFIEVISRSAVLPQDVEEIQVKKKADDTFSIKLLGKGTIQIQKLSQKIDDLDNQLQEQLLPYATIAYDFYKDKVTDVVQTLDSLFGSTVEIQARAKGAVSAANRLMRTEKMTWGPREGITNRDDAIKNLWDAIGSRIIPKTGTDTEIQKIVDTLSEAIRNGTLEVTHLNNLRGSGGLPYFSDSQITQIRQADAERVMNLAQAGIAAQPIIIGNSERKGGSPFTAICAYIKHGDGVIGELQIIGSRVLRLANAEHFPYDAMINKDLYRELNDAGKKAMEPYFEPFIAAIKSLSASEKNDYNAYLNECYILERKIENGKASPTDKVSLPPTCKPELRVENIIAISEIYEKVKKTMKK